MKLSTAVFASILSVCLTVSYVSGQIVFPDSTVQTTAAGGGVFIVQPGDAYHYSYNSYYSELIGTLAEYPYGGPISDPVPAGYELVILQISVHGDTNSPAHYFYEVDQGGVGYSLYSAYNQDTDAYAPETVHFPNGVFTIDEGNQLYVSDRPVENSGDRYYRNTTVFGYYRQK